LGVGSKIDAGIASTSLASARGIELVDPSGDAGYGLVCEEAGGGGLVCEEVGGGHSCSAGGPTQFHHEQRAFAVAGKVANESRNPKTPS